MTTATLSYPRIHKNNHSKTKSMELPQANWGIICIVGIVFCSFLLFFYIYQINVLTRGTYLVAGYENTIDKISEENQKLEVNFAENSFLGEVLTKTQDLNFQKTTLVKYIQVLESSLANAK